MRDCEDITEEFKENKGLFEQNKYEFDESWDILGRTRIARNEHR